MLVSRGVIKDRHARRLAAQDGDTCLKITEPAHCEIHRKRCVSEHRGLNGHTWRAAHLFVAGVLFNAELFPNDLAARHLKDDGALVISPGGDRGSLKASAMCTFGVPRLFARRFR